MSKGSRPKKKFCDKTRKRIHDKESMDFARRLEIKKQLDLVPFLEKMSQIGYVHVETDKSIREAVLEGQNPQLRWNVKPILEMFDGLKPFWVRAQYTKLKDEEARTMYIAAHHLVQEEEGTSLLDVGIELGRTIEVDPGENFEKMAGAFSLMHFYDLDHPRQDPNHREIVWFYPNPKEREILQKQYDEQCTDPSNPFNGRP